MRELQRLPETGAAAMVGYLLKNTVTAHGTVSRGVCHVKDGYLSDIRETLKIALLQDGVIRDEDTGAVLDGDTVVSMNFWGFAPPSSTRWRRISTTSSAARRGSR